MCGILSIITSATKAKGGNKKAFYHYLGGPKGGVTVEPTEEPEGEGEEPSPDEEPTIPPGGQPP